jgi:hypothetical protein
MFSLLHVLAWVTAGLAVVCATVVAAGGPRAAVTPAAPSPSGQPAPDSPSASRPPTPAGDDNPPVRPGLVRWHSSFADARLAAQRSGRPVLLFHLMGRLDRQFC